MAFPRIRTSGQWLNGSTILQSELEQLDEDHSNALDGAAGGAYAPTAPLVIGGAGLHVTGDFSAPGVADGPMRGFGQASDTGDVADHDNQSLIVWAPFDLVTPAPNHKWIVVYAAGANLSGDEDTWTNSTPFTFDTANDGWHDIAASPTNAVVIGFRLALSTPTAKAWYCDNTYAWSNTAGVSNTGAICRSIKWSGTYFVISHQDGSFSRSTDGSDFGTAISGPTNWAGGATANYANQINVGLGPALAHRMIAVAGTGTNRNYFAISDDHGATWSEVAVADLDWRGVAYRARDHVWCAVANSGEVYASTDGGATWSQVASGYVSFARKVELVNNVFVSVNGWFQIVFSYDLVNWYRGHQMFRTSWAPSPLAVGNGGLAYAQANSSGGSNPVEVRFSQKASSTYEAAL